MQRLREIAQVATRHGFGYVFERRALRRSAVDRRPEPACPRPAPARDARRARPDVRQVRPAPLDPARHRAAGDPRRAAPAPGRGHAVPCEDVERVIEEDLRATSGKLFTASSRAGGGRLDRPGAPRRAGQPAGGSRSRCSGPSAARQIESDLGAAATGREASSSAASTGSTSSTRSSCRRRVCPVDPPRARLPHRGAQRPRSSARRSPTPASRRSRRSTGTYSSEPGADARAAGRGCSSPTSTSTQRPGRAPQGSRR